MKEIQKILLHSIELTKQIAEAITVRKFDNGEDVRLNKQLLFLQEHASAIDTLLSELALKYKPEESLAKFKIWERKLLDLTLRNNLLNMKLGRSAIRLTSNDGVCKISDIEDYLDEGKELHFEQKELKGIYRTARTNLEESGANTLFLALGCLNWLDKQSGRTFVAPILLVPIEMVATKGSQYVIRKRDEEVLLNITLIEFLKQTFEITINGIYPLPQDAHGVDVSFVLHLVSAAISGKTGWSVTEDMILGNFSFTKFVMWNDIHSHASAMQSSPIVRSLIEGQLLLDDSNKPAADAREMEINKRPDALAVPVDADSSQLEAISDAQAGRSFLLYGPPGTGKSQTITNLIANALYHNKRVLFVAQKKAALDVVESRLAKIGIAPFCLELHSNKMDKRRFLQQMELALQNTKGNPIEEYAKKSNELYNHRMRLASFIKAMHSHKKYGVSLYECIEQYLAIKAEPLSLPKDFCKDITNEVIEELCTKIRSLDATTNILDGKSPSEHPLYGLFPKQNQQKRTHIVSPIKGDSFDELLSNLPQTISEIKKTIERNSKFSFATKTTRQYIEGDYKMKKFLQQADINDTLMDNIDTLSQAADRWAKNTSLLPQWQKYAALLNGLKQEGLEKAISMYELGISSGEICQAFLAGCYKQMAEDIISKDDTLVQFQGILFEQVIDKYKRLAKEFQELTSQELVSRISTNIDIELRKPENSAELTLLRKRIGNKGRGTTIRNIIDQMPNLLPKIHPVMLMSPLSVAQYLNTDGEKFDIVVFDEASQMLTCEAVGALARAKSAVIVGDPQQMPPTNFFSVNTTDEEETEIDDLESILDDCISLSMPARYLKWHYRSKHESLIQFSNENYYQDRLITFPSVDNMQSKVTWQYVDGVYDLGKTRTNRGEAEAIVIDVIYRLKTSPERSIGIIAFSKAQSDLIEDILNEELAKYPQLAIQNKENKEPLFVKNLENVQGDERDIILFSIGYGPDKDGNVSMNFGPLNKDGGERRLNVAVSRARYEMKVFSTLKPEQIDERRTNAEGVLGLKRFLKFAQNGCTRLSETNDSKNNSIISEIVSELQKRGYDVHTNIGTSICRVDIAVVNSTNPAEYALGIVIDGEDYFRMKTVRDREIVRSSVLNMLGWRLMHVWTLDWFSHRETVLKNILEQLKKA